MSDDIDYEKLDPGIRRLVRVLRDQGFVTTDSGDGVSKIGVPEAMTIPHVHIQVCTETMIVESHRLADLFEQGLREVAGEVAQEAADAPLWTSFIDIQATYSPLDGVAVLSLLILRGTADKLCDWCNL